MNEVITPGIAAAPAAFEQMVAQLHRVAERIAAGDERAAVELHPLLTRLQGHADPRCTGLLVFASALAQRVSGAMAQTANLYLRRFEVPQIELFNLLGRCLPIASMATRMANTAVTEALRGQAHATVIDIGIGTGRQIMALLEQLDEAGELPPTLTVIGIEPAAEALAAARTGLLTHAAALGITLTFHGIAACSESLGADDWARIRSWCPGRPVINAAFALHHIADDAQGHDRRNPVLRQLHALDPLALVLIEPDVDHLEPRFLPRFRNCWRHFAAVFELLDSLPLGQAERDAIKVGFFGREIHDVLGTAEPLRSERHETSADWLRRLVEAGFVPQDAGLPPGGHAAISAQAHGTHLALAVGGEPVLAVLVARPLRELMRQSRRM